MTFSIPVIAALTLILYEDIAAHASFTATRKRESVMDMHAFWCIAGEVSMTVAAFSALFSIGGGNLLRDLPLKIARVVCVISFILLGVCVYQATKG
jgi:hypothetical protein